MSRTPSSNGSCNDSYAGFRRSRPSSTRRRSGRSTGSPGWAAGDCRGGGSYEDGDDDGPPPYPASCSSGSSTAGSLDRYHGWSEEDSLFQSARQDECGSCKTFLNYHCNSFCFKLDSRELATATATAAHTATPSESLESDVHELLKILNALLNDCGGGLSVHLSQPCSVTSLDALVDHRLIAMIPNDTAYEDNFERLVPDEHHVLYRVKPSPNPIVSTLVFPSMLAHNRGLSQPSQQQIQKLVLGCFQTPSWTEGSERDRDTGYFVQGEPVKLYPSCTDHLQSLDALAVQEHPGNSFGEKVAEFWWNVLHLAKYMAALCKLQAGGSVFLGMDEERLEPTKKWKLVEGCDFGMLFPGSTKKMWEDIEVDNDIQHRHGGRSNGVNNAVHHLAREEDVPRAEGRLTGRYVCQGFELTRQDREALRASLLKKVRSDMLWYPGYPSKDPVSVTFHPVNSRGGPENLCVVEVMVSKFHGVAFHDRRGPEAFQIMPGGSFQDHQVKALSLGEFMTQVSGYPLRGYDPREESRA